MRSRIQWLSVWTAIILCILGSVNARGQSVRIREHKKVPFTKKMTLKVVKNNGLTFKGRWQMETAEAISIELPSGREVIVPKSEIAELYKCRTQTNEYFFYGFLTGTVISLAIIYIDKEGPSDVSGFFASTMIGAFCGLISAVYGSFQESCERYYFDNATPDLSTADNKANRRMELGVCFRF